MFKTIVLTIFSLLAFAGNSVLSRLALAGSGIDAMSFACIRLVSGAVLLYLLFLLVPINKTKGSVTKGSWMATVMLFTYAMTFSFAYVSLDTASGALILFAFVQITMIINSFISGKRIHLNESLGAGVAFLGLLYFLFPDASSPSFNGFFLMLIAGVAWAVYTLLGKGSESPLSDTAFNFIRAVILVIPCLLLSHWYGLVMLSVEGVVLAMLSGGVTSGLGYAIWYMALKGLSNMQAASVQLLVPVIAALGGVIFTGELLSSHLLVSSLIVLGGIALVIFGRK